MASAESPAPAPRSSCAADPVPKSEVLPLPLPMLLLPPTKAANVAFAPRPLLLLALAAVGLELRSKSFSPPAAFSARRRRLLGVPGCGDGGACAASMASRTDTAAREAISWTSASAGASRRLPLRFERLGEAFGDSSAILSGGREPPRGARGPASAEASSPGSGMVSGGGPSKRPEQGAEEARGAGGGVNASPTALAKSQSVREGGFTLPDGVLGSGGDGAAAVTLRRPPVRGRMELRSPGGCGGLTGSLASLPVEVLDANRDISCAISLNSLRGGAAGSVGSEGRQSTGNGSSPGGASRGRSLRSKDLRVQGASAAAESGRRLSKPAGASSLPQSSGPKMLAAPPSAPSTKVLTRLKKSILPDAEAMENAGAVFDESRPRRAAAPGGGTGGFSTIFEGAAQSCGER